MYILTHNNNIIINETRDWIWRRQREGIQGGQNVKAVIYIYIYITVCVCVKKNKKIRETMFVELNNTS